MASVKTGTVYALVDPRDNQVRYIGATTMPLRKRLQGHLKSPAPRVKGWVDELAAAGVVPRIHPIKADVAADELRNLERDEITRRLIAGEPLLNESATAPARRHIERQQRLARQERQRAAWEVAAQQVRAAIGGPLPPGDIPPVPLDEKALVAYHSLCDALDVSEKEFPAQDREGLNKATRLMLLQEKAGEDLWLSTRPVWGHLRGTADRGFEFLLSARVGTVFQKRWTDVELASSYLALLPWGIMAVGPWAALAERAGMDASGPDFIDWVSDDPSVREALAILLLRSDDRMGPLSALDNSDGGARPSSGLVALTAAHCPGFDLPDALQLEVTSFIEFLQRGGELTPGLVDLLLELDPQALDNLLGPDIVARIDAQLSLPPGTSLDVLTALLESKCPWHLGNLGHVVARGKEAFPTVATPDFNRWVGSTGPQFQAIVGSLVVAGHLPAPSGSTPEEFVGEIRALWRGDLGALGLES